MKNCMKALPVVVGLAVIATMGSSVPLLSAQRQGQPSGPTPRLAGGKPDLQGVWQRPYVPDMTRDGRDQKGHAEPPFAASDSTQTRQDLRKQGQYGDLPYTPEGLKAWKAYDINTLNDPGGPGDYTGSCFPFGLSRSINSPEPLQIMQNDRYLAILFEQNTWFHVVYLDGREHPKDDSLPPTWFGHSVGRWDGDTLVIDTVGFNGFTRLDTVGHPHSDQLHLTQTLRRLDRDHLAFTITVEDPKTYTTAWTNRRTFTLSNSDLLEYSCEENNRSLWEGRLKLWLPPWARDRSR